MALADDQKIDVRHLLGSRNGRASAELALRVVFHAVCLVGSAWAFENRAWLVFAGFLVPHFIFFSFLGWAGIGHELFHATVFSSRRLNSFLFRFFSMLTWNNYAYFEVTHPIHHRRTLLPGDPEGRPNDRFSAADVLWSLSVDVPNAIRKIKILAINAAGRVPPPFGDTIFTPGSMRRKRLVRAARITLAYQIFTAVAFVAFDRLDVLLSLTFAPFMLTFFNRFLASAQHYGLASTEQNHEDYVVNSRTVRLGLVWEFFYANMNFHVEHHFFPNVPYYNLRQVHDMLKASRPDFKFTSGMTELIRNLAGQGLFDGVK